MSMYWTQKHWCNIGRNLDTINILYFAPVVKANIFEKVNCATKGLRMNIQDNGDIFYDRFGIS